MVSKPAKSMSILFFKKLQISSQKTLILGGSFNPPHRGHLYLSMVAARALKIKKIIWIVANNNPFKPKIHNFYERFLLCKNITEKYHNISVSNIEHQLGVSETYRTLRYLRKNNTSSDNIIWLMGMDNLLHFDKWKNFKEIILHHKIVVISRGDNLEKMRFLNSRFCKMYKLQIGFAKHTTTKITIVNSAYCDVSSTQIRRSLPQSFAVK